MLGLLAAGGSDEGQTIYRRTDHRSWCTVPSADTRRDRALAPDAEESHIAGALLFTG
jgi:hypothetical protein